MKAKYVEILSNSVFMYTRHFIVLISGLISTRLLLSGFGTAEYGKFLSIWSFVFIFSFISGTLSSTVLRYFSHDIELKTESEIRKLLASSLTIAAIICVILLVLFLTFGHKIYDIFHLSDDSATSELYTVTVCILITLLIGMISSIYASILLALEKFKEYTQITLIEVLLKLFCAAIISSLHESKALYYSIMIGAVSLFVCYLYYFKLRKIMPSLYFSFKSVSLQSIRNLSTYAGWTFFGQLTTSLRIHGLTFVIASLFAPEIVVARAVSVQVANNIVTFGNNFSKSSYPKIIKSWSSSNHTQMYGLIHFSTIITFSLIWIVSYPVFIFTSEILEIWLVVPPELTVDFVKIVSLEATLTATALPIMAAARAPGNIKTFELVLGCMQLLAFILISSSIIILKNPLIAPFGILLLTSIMFPVRLYLTARLTGLSIMDYFRNSLVPITIIILVSAILYYIYLLMGYKTNTTKLIFIIANLFTTASITAWIVRKELWR